jgi:hypothetical protein
MRIKLEAISLGKASRLRSYEVIGDAAELPQVGKRFVMTAEPIDPNSLFRLVETSPVTELGPANEFRTSSGSHYRLHTI